MGNSHSSSRKRNRDELEEEKQQQGLFIEKLLEEETSTRVQWKSHLSSVDPDGFAWYPDPCQSLQEQFKDPGKEKIPRYIAFSGSSGSGKTTAMLYLLYRFHKSQTIRSCKWVFKLFISCESDSDESLGDFVTNTIQNFSTSWEGFDEQVVREVLEKSALLLALDEVPNRWKHNDYYYLSDKLRSKFGISTVVLLVGSTALNQDVCRQPTNALNVVNIRMCTILDEKRAKILEHHLMQELELSPRISFQSRQDKISKTRRFVEKLFYKIPYLYALLGNHRCAFLTATVLIKMFGEKYWEEKLDEGSCEGNLEYILIKVADEYRARNGLKNLSMQKCRTYMLQSLALVASQKHNVRLVDKNPRNDSLAMLSKELVEIGLIERTIDPDKRTGNDNLVAVSDCYEFEMTPAVTMLCVGTLFPWIGGIRGAAERFEALVAVLLVVLRYAQTHVRYPIHRLKQAVPYSGNETGKYYCPSIRIDEKCFINGPKAPFADVIIAGAPPTSEEKSGLMAAISSLVNESGFAVEPLLVQCKYTTNETARCTFKDEFAKMGFEPQSPENPRGKDQKISKQYQAADALKSAWVCENSEDNALPLFATNKRFSDRFFMDEHSSDAIFMEETVEAEFAWKTLYPIIDILPDDLGGDVDRDEIKWSKKKGKWRVKKRRKNALP